MTLAFTRSHRCSAPLAALAAGLWLWAPPALAKVPSKLPDDPVVGRDLYQDHCWQCHGVEGLGDGPLAGALTTAVPSLRGRAELEWPGLVDVVLTGRGDMPAHSAILSKPAARRIFVWLSALDAGDTEVPATREASTPPPTPAAPDARDAADDDGSDASGPPDGTE